MWPGSEGGAAQSVLPLLTPCGINWRARLRLAAGCAPSLVAHLPAALSPTPLAPLAHVHSQDGPRRRVHRRVGHQDVQPSIGVKRVLDEALQAGQGRRGGGLNSVQEWHPRVSPPQQCTNKAYCLQGGNCQAGTQTAQRQWACR